MLRDVFGSPLRPFELDPGWLANEGQRAVALAREIDEEGRFEALPVLADALDHAGCHNAAVLDHCRGPNVHIRGCWVIDALRGREPAVRKGMTTQADWLVCDNPVPLLAFLNDKGTERTWRLFAVACCKRIDSFIIDPGSVQRTHSASSIKNVRGADRHALESPALGGRWLLGPEVTDRFEGLPEFLRRNELVRRRLGHLNVDAKPHGRAGVRASSLRARFHPDRLRRAAASCHPSFRRPAR